MTFSSERIAPVPASNRVRDPSRIEFLYLKYGPRVWRPKYSEVRLLKSFISHLAITRVGSLGLAAHFRQNEVRDRRVPSAIWSTFDLFSRVTKTAILLQRMFHWPDGGCGVGVAI